MKKGWWRILTVVVVVVAMMMAMGTTVAGAVPANTGMGMEDNQPGDGGPVDGNADGGDGQTNGDTQTNGDAQTNGDGQTDGDVPTDENNTEGGETFAAFGAPAAELPGFAPMSAVITHDLDVSGPLAIPADSSDTYVVTSTSGSYAAAPGAAPVVAVGNNFSGSLTVGGVAIIGDSPGVQVAPGFTGTLTLAGFSFTGGAYHGVEIQDGSSGTLMLDNCVISVNDGTSASRYSAAIVVNGNGDVANVTNNIDIVLTNGSNNELYSGDRRAGLEVMAGGQIEISGDGALTARCGTAASTGSSTYGAGIGAGHRDASGYIYGGNVVIRSGNITAIAGYHGAGIGGSGFGSGEPVYNGHVVITGGVIVSSGGAHGSGIGGGCSNNYASNASRLTGSILVLNTAYVQTTAGGNRPLVGSMASTIYLGDPSAHLVQIRTAESTPGIEIFMDLSGVPEIVQMLADVGISAAEVDPATIPVGVTDATGVANVNMVIPQPVRFYTNALSSQGQPFESNSVVVDQPQQVVLVPYTPGVITPPADTPVITVAAAPQTGDAANATMWIALSVAAVLGLCGASLYARRKTARR